MKIQEQQFGMSTTPWTASEEIPPCEARLRPDSDGGVHISLRAPPFCFPELLPVRCVLALYFGVVSGEATPAKAELEAAPTARIALYGDDSRLGNNLRPGKGRKYYCIYWIMFGLPDWFRASVIGWFPICFVLVDTVDKIAGRLSCVMARILGTRFSSTTGACNFATKGMRLPLSASMAASRLYLWFRANFDCFLLDEEALKELSGCKGASGVKPCIHCSNILGLKRYRRNAMPRGNGFPHHSVASLEMSMPHTRESLLAIADYLSAKAAEDILPG